MAVRQLNRMTLIFLLIYLLALWVVVYLDLNLILKLHVSVDLTLNVLVVVEVNRHDYSSFFEGLIQSSARMNWKWNCFLLQFMKNNIFEPVVV